MNDKNSNSKSVPFKEEYEIEVRVNEIVIKGKGMEEFSAFQSALEDAVAYGYDTDTEEWSITVEKEKPTD